MYYAYTGFPDREMARIMAAEPLVFVGKPPQIDYD